MDGTTYIEIAVNGHTIEYGAFTTDAPDVYDGFGTIRLAKYSSGNIVLIAKQHENWQLQNYASGRHYAKNLEYHGVATDVARMIWARIQNREEQ